MSVHSASDLRREFDASFAEPPPVIQHDPLDLLVISAGGEAFALGMSELGGVVQGRRLTPLPSPEPALLGLLGIRGTVVAAYDLASLLRLPRGATAPRCFATARDAPRIAIAFDEVLAHRRIAPDALHRAHDGRQGIVEHAFRSGSTVIPLLVLPLLVDRALGRATPNDTTQRRLTDER